MNRVDRIILLAAGKGSRLLPITNTIPKPLVEVNGERIIDTLIDGAIKAEIPEIYIVRGYKSNNFNVLLDKYPNIRFVENPYYENANNISSVLCASDLVQNAYICEADLVLYNKDLLSLYQEHSNYLGVPTKRTEDWCFFCDEKGGIQRFEIGGNNCHHMFGISYWTEKDGKQLESDIIQEFNMPGGRDKYWDQIPLQHYREHYNIFVRECTFEDIIEIDTYDELKQIDKSYQ